jgi:hypothetical protein
MHDEREATRVAYRKSITGFKNEIINHVQNLCRYENSHGKPITIAQLWKSFTPGYCTREDVVQAVIELGQMEKPFVWHKVNGNDQITAVWYSEKGE